jgi:Lactoylglutathione lyase and related lyases
MARITGIGGIFFKSPDPAKLAAWYREVLGLDVQDWGGALIKSDDPARPDCAVWSPFAADTTYYQPSVREFMLNFAVDDLDAMVASLEAKGVSILGRMEEEQGRFAWILDPDGTKIELWEPKSAK